MESVAHDAPAYKGTKRDLLELHLRNRHAAFEAVDAVLAEDREGYLAQQTSLATSLLEGGRHMDIAKEWAFGGNRNEYEALMHLTFVAAEIVWLLEERGFPAREDVVAWYRLRHKAQKDAEKDAGFEEAG